MTPVQILETLMDVGLKAANPYRSTYANLPGRPTGRLFILAVGKAATPMARAASEFYGEGFDGVLLAPIDYAEDIPGFEVFEGTHPVPSKTNVEITGKIVDYVKRLKKDDMLLALISGGTSALLCRPKKGVTLEEKIKTTKKLLKSGVDIHELNAKRKEMSAVKGGKLADLAAPASVETLIISDVPGDDPAVIGSAPTGGGKVVLKADDMLMAIAEQAERLALGLSVTNLGGAVRGEAREVADVHARLALEITNRPHLIVSGGEMSVTVTGKGTGGRNSEYALALALALKGAENIHALAVDTDGRDGTGSHAGVLVKPDTLARAKTKRLNPEKSLKNNDSGTFFYKLGDGVMTGPTMTNLNDLRMILVV